MAGFPPTALVDGAEGIRPWLSGSSLGICPLALPPRSPATGHPTTVAPGRSRGRGAGHRKRRGQEATSASGDLGNPGSAGVGSEARGGAQGRRRRLRKEIGPGRGPGGADTPACPVSPQTWERLSAPSSPYLKALSLRCTHPLRRGRRRQRPTFRVCRSRFLVVPLFSDILPGTLRS